MVEPNECAIFLKSTLRAKECSVGMRYVSFRR